MAVSIFIALAMAAPEPVVWTKMADPDPHYVAPQATVTRQRATAKASTGRSSEPDNMEGALVNLMKAGKEAQDKAFRDYERKLQRLEEMADRVERTADQTEGDNPQQ